ncbi:MAG: DUF1236 domain-containing protein [Proteobacteria bacterium]|nr:DUF1236 domain-containing protein [Pseudomonadota bacterium]
MTRSMLLRGRTAAAATALLLAGGLAASAQTTIITTQPQATTGTAVVAAPARVELTPVQRQTVYRTIIRERAVPAQPTVEYRVGTRVPEATQLYAVPQDVVAEVPAVRSYKYMVVNNRVLLVDPATSEVVAELAN